MITYTEATCPTCGEVFTFPHNSPSQMKTYCSQECVRKISWSIFNGMKRAKKPSQPLNETWIDLSKVKL